MKKTNNRNMCQGLILGLYLLGTAVSAQEVGEDAPKLRAEIAKIKKEINKAEIEMRRTDSLLREEQAIALKNLERRQKDKERRQKENAELNATLQETRAKISAERGRMQGAQNGIQEIQLREKALQQWLAGVADSLLRRIGSGLPWDVEARRERLLVLKRDVEAGSASSEEALSRLTAVLKEEIKNGDEVTLFNRPVTRSNGDVVNAQLLKLGNRAVLYMDDEEKKFGILEPKRENGKITYAWREELSANEKSSIRQSLAVKTGRDAPQLVPLNLAFIADSTAQGGR